MLVRKADVGIAIQSGRVCLEVWSFCENMLGSRAAESVFGAEKENAHPLLFEVDAEKFVLSAHEELSVTQGQGAPVAEIFFTRRVGPEHIGLSE